MRALALALLAAALLAGCADDAEPEAEEPSAEEIVSRSAAAMEEVETFHFVYDVDATERGGAGPLAIAHAEGEVARPGRVRADVVATFAGIGLETELIVVDDESFIEDPLTGGWREITGVLDAGAVFDPAEGVVSVISGAQDLELVGREERDGVPTYHLTGRVPARDLSPMIGNPPSDELVPADLWVGVDDFLVRRIVVHGPLFEEESEDTERTITASRYGEPVEIARPD